MLAIYEYAKDLHEERLRRAERARLIAGLRSAGRRAQAARGTAAHDEWSVVWSNSDLTGKAVTMVNNATGEKHTGRDPGDWDEALGDVVRQLGAGV